MKRNIGLGLAIIAMAFVIFGCTPPNAGIKNPYAGPYGSGSVVLIATRGGGPTIDIGSTTVQPDDGRFGGTINYYPGAMGGPFGGGITGQVNLAGDLNATVTLADNRGHFVISGAKPVVTPLTRGGGGSVAWTNVRAIFYGPTGETEEYYQSNVTFWK